MLSILLVKNSVLRYNPPSLQVVQQSHQSQTFLIEIAVANLEGFLMKKRVLVWLSTAVFPLITLIILFQNQTNAGVGAPVVIDAILYDGLVSGELDEAVRIRNVTDVPFDIGGWTIGDGESTLTLPQPLTLPSGNWLWLARNGNAFAMQFGHPPDYELQETSPDIPNLTGTWSGLNNSGDQLLLSDGATLIDCVPFEGRYQGECGTQWSGEVVQPYNVGGVFGSEGQILYRKRDEQSGWPLADTNTAVDWAQDRQDSVNGRRVWYPGWDTESFFEPVVIQETAVLTVAITPDNGYAALVQQIDSAQESIQLEALTFENIGIANALTEAANRGVAVTLLLEGAPAGGIDDAERYACQRLEAAGGACWFMISDDENDIFDRYRFLHAKFMIVDGKTAVISSENLSPNSLPYDDKSDGTWGRRGVLLMTDAPGVITHLQTLFAADLDPANHVDLFRWQSNHGSYGAPPPDFAPITETGGVTYTVRYPTAVSFSDATHFSLIQSPENSLRQSDGLLGLLNEAGGGDTILVQQLVERPYWGQAGEQAPNLRLDALINAARRGAMVRLLLDSYFDDGDDLSNKATCELVRQVAWEERIDLHCQIANPAGLGIHNKMFLMHIGGKGYVHVGSINGTEQSNKGNRELALQVQSDEAYAYLAEMFATDWPLITYLPTIYQDFGPPIQHLLISELLYNPNGPDDAEFVEIYNPTATAVNITNASLSDATAPTDFEDLRRFPSGTVLQAGQVIVVATTATGFEAAFGFTPDFEIVESDTAVPNLIDDPNWGDPAATFQLGNQGDEVILRSAVGEVVDVVVYGNGAFPGHVACELIQQQHVSYERFPSGNDSDSCPNDFREWPFPNPGQLP